MPTFAPYLLGGKTLQGVQPPSDHNVSHKNHSLVDIESCIDDPHLAPLGEHVRADKTQEQQKQRSKEGQVRIRKKQLRREIREDGVLLLRRRGMESAQLSEQLDGLLPPLAPFLNPMTRLQGLVELDISRNRLTQLPSNLAMLNYLKILNVSANRLATVPTVLYNLGQLEVLNLSQNLITEIPSEMAIRLRRLKTLRMSANRIERIEADLALWEEMEHLQLGSVFGGNLLTQVPDQIADMQRLQELDLSHNQLRSLPCNMRLERLEHLNLTFLEFFDLSENLLCIMPADILQHMRSTTLLITGNPLIHDISGVTSANNTSDAYAQIVRQMTMRAVPMSPLCGPRGMGCEGGPSSLFLHRHRHHHHHHHQHGFLGNLDDHSNSSSSSSSSSSNSNNNNNNSDNAISIPRPTTRRPRFPFFHDHDDHDASIDRELLYHARQLNIRGSRPGTPQTLMGVLSPPLPPLQDDDTQEETDPSQLMEDPLVMEHDDEEQVQESMEFQGHHLIHSLREIAARHILKNKMRVPLHMLPMHLAQDLENHSRLCVACQSPFVNEWVTSVQVKSFKGHPAVVHRVRFCSTTCWRSCLGKDVIPDDPPIIHDTTHIPPSPSSTSSISSMSASNIHWIETTATSSLASH
ncbi:L domain-like protein [Lichtheimia hyalospora FSU 10163]|nr:L domain-like protein [Lichtheimia hyalospora FSU 10163]